MAGTGPLDLYDVAGDLLSACEEALDTLPDYDATLRGAPSRSFVSPGAPVWDCCEMLAVHVQQVTDRLASDRVSDAKINTPQLIATVTRCVSVGTGEPPKYKPPSLAAMEKEARQISADGWALWNHLYNMTRAKPPTFLTRCAGARFNSMAQVTPEGGCGGWQLSFTVDLDGYEEDLDSS